VITVETTEDMRKLMVNIIVPLAFGLCARLSTQAQGTTYVSNLGTPFSGSVSAATDSWAGVEFRAGSNAGGYYLDSVQLEMTAAIGSPNAFNVMIYRDVGLVGPHPGVNLATLSGSANPSLAGVYSYTPTSQLVLTPATSYYIIVTAGTPAADGAYQWGYAATYSYNLLERWNTSPYQRSADGSAWYYLPGIFPEFAINATPVPEPYSAGLLIAGVLCLLHRQMAK
jgi:hypothetical protein